MDTKYLVLLSTLCCLSLLTIWSYFGIFSSSDSPPSLSSSSFSSFSFQIDQFLSQLNYNEMKSNRSSEGKISLRTLTYPLSEDGCIMPKTRFLNNGYKRPRVGLISFPRSGNSMTRALIEQLTGIWTGSDGIDEDLLSFGYLGEGYADDTVSVIKYHALRNESWWLDAFKFDKLIYLYRNPFESFLSRMNKQAGGGHNETAKFYRQDVFRWKTLFKWTPLWKRHVQTFVLNLTNNMYYSSSDGRYLPVLHLRYEDLDSNSPNFNPNTMAEHLSRIATFLELPYISRPKPLDAQVLKGTAVHRERLHNQDDVFPYNRTAADFIDIPPPITKEKIQCICAEKKKANGYIRRKKEMKYAVDAWPKDLQEYVISRLRVELCLLGLTTLKPNMTIECGKRENTPTEEKVEEWEEYAEYQEYKNDGGEEEEEGSEAEEVVEEEVVEEEIRR